MHVKRIEGAEIVLGAPKGWREDDLGKCVGLPVRIENHEGVAFMVSAWEPTPDELRRLNSGAPVLLMVSAPQHPVVAISVGEPAA